jgi:hypothetical protein
MEFTGGIYPVSYSPTVAHSHYEPERRCLSIPPHHRRRTSHSAATASGVHREGSGVQCNPPGLFVVSIKHDWRAQG